jgi:hypothetical protein
MTVTFDAVANLGTANSTSGLSGSFTLGSSATCLVVLVGGFFTSGNISSLTTRTCKVGTTSLTLLASTNNSSATATTKGYTEMWGLIGPPTGAQTISVVENKTTTAAFLNVTAISFNGVSQFGTGVTNLGTATTASAATSGAIVSSTGSRVLSVAGTYDATLALTGSGTLRSNMPATATLNYVTLLVQDQAGAATVTNTATASNGWGVCSVNLVAGTRWTVNASQALTVSRSASASFVGLVRHVNAAQSWTVTATASVTAQHQGPPLRYVGPIDTNNTITTAAYSQIDDNTFLVTPAFITQQVNAAAASLVTPAFVTQAASAYLTQTAVNTALAAFVPTSQLGAAHGVAQLGPDGLIPAGQLQLPLVTNNLAKVYDATTNGTIFLPSGNAFTVVTTNINEFVAANVNVPNPGYPWIPLPFAYIGGHSSNTSSGSRLAGNGNYGMMTCTLAGKTLPLYGVGLATDDTLFNYYVLTPCGIATNPAVTPLNQVPLEGAQTLELGLCNWSGSQYTFSGTGMFFYVLVVPAIGSIA